MGQPFQDRVRQRVAKRNDRTLVEWYAQMAQEYQTPVSVATLWRRLQRRGLPRKKMLHTVKRETPRIPQARLSYGEPLAEAESQRLKCVDTSEDNLALPRL